MILVKAVLGASASSRKEKYTLTGFLDKIMSWFGPSDFMYREISSQRFDRDDFIEDIYQHKKHIKDGILLVGKSHGAVKIWDSLMKDWDEYEDLMNMGHKISVVLIDPHGPNPGDGKFGSYGTFLRKTMKKNPEWETFSEEFNIKCFYQRNKYPKGARFAGKGFVEYNYKLKDGTHWNVTNIKTRTGKEIASYIGEEIEWLQK